MALSANSDMKLSANEEEALADTARSSTNPVTRLLFVLIAAAVVLGGLWIGVGDQIMAMITGDDGDVPTITAEGAPIKVRPESPGGMQVPNQGRLVYGVVDGSSAQPRMERLLPSPEKPVEVENVLTRDVPETKAVVANTAPRGTADPPLSSTPSASDVAALSEAPSPPPMPTATAPNSGAPRALTPQSNPTASASAPPPPPAPTAAPETAAAPPPPPVAPSAPSTVATLPTPKPAPKPAPEPSSTVVASAPPASAKTPADLDKSYRVQLAAARSEPALRSEWDRLQSRNKDILGELELQVTRIDLGATKGIFYRLRAGPLENATAAKALCERLKQRKLGCLVVKPGA